MLRDSDSSWGIEHEGTSRRFESRMGDSEFLHGMWVAWVVTVSVAVGLLIFALQKDTWRTTSIVTDPFGRRLFSF